MTQVYTEDGSAVPVTLVSVENVKVAKHLKVGEQVTHVELGKDARKNTIKSDVGNYKELGYVPRYKRVFAVSTPDVPAVGTEVGVETFEVGEKVDVTGVNKGKGFQGVVKRHGHKGGPKTHGGPTGKMRSGGSIGAGTTPGRVVKGMPMPGRMGGKRFTVQNVKIAVIDPETKIIGVAGSIPGPNKGYVVIQKHVKDRA